MENEFFSPFTKFFKKRKKMNEMRLTLSYVIRFPYSPT